MKNKNLKTVLILILLCVVIALVPLLTLHHSEFGGSDDQAENVIAEVDPTYVPWAESVITLPSGEVESLLFCLQAALGSGVLCFGFGWLAAKKKYSAKTSKPKMTVS